LVDAKGARHIPHYRAIDIASDNRIAPGKNSLSHHQFTLPSGCDDGVVKAQVLYRPIPTAQAQIRGWEAKDYVIAQREESW